MRRFLLLAFSFLLAAMCYGQQLERNAALSKLASNKNAERANILQSKATRSEWTQISQNFIATDLNGNTHNLQQYLDAGKTVIVDLSTVWCGYCRTLHQSGVFDDLYEAYGPEGTDEIVVLWVEAEGASSGLIHNTPQNAQNFDWTLGDTWPIPIISSATVINSFANSEIEGYPTVFMICPSGYYKNIYPSLTSQGAEAIHNGVSNCPQPEAAPVVEIIAPEYGIVGEEITFDSEIISIADITSCVWTIEGGNPSTATTTSATAVFDAVGTYTITLEVSNENGTETVTHTIQIFDCSDMLIDEFPYTQNFDEFSVYPPCWTVLYNEPRNAPWVQQILGTNAFIFSSYYASTDYNEYLISAEISSSNLMRVSFLYAVGNSASEGETFRVGYSTTDNNVDSFIWGEYVTATNNSAYENFTAFVPAETKYVAINYNTDYEYFLIIDNIQIVEVTEPALNVMPTAMSFREIYGNVSEAKTANVSALLVTEDIVATASENFEVSADGENFASTANIDADGGLLYVRYNPTEAGVHTGIVALLGSGATAEITLSGEAVDCSTSGISSFPYEENFDLGLPICWRYIDADGDGNNWASLAETFAHAGMSSYVSNYVHGTDAALGVSFTFDSHELYVDNYMITPEIEVPTEGVLWLSYNVLGLNAGFPDTYNVLVSTTGNDAADFTDLLFTEDVVCDLYEERVISLAEYAGQTIHIAFEHVSNAKYMFAIDDFRLDIYTDPIINVTPLAMNFVTIFGNVSEAQSANVILANVTEDVNVAASDNFEVSADGLTFASTATLSADGGSFFVRYNPTSTGSHNGTVQISNSQIEETITLTGLARDCSGSITEFPFVEDFEGGISYCWLNIDADEDGNSWEDASGYITSFMGHGNSTNAAMSLSYDNYISSALTPDNWLITKPFEIPEGSNMELSFFVAAQDDNYAQEHYGVFVSIGSADIADFELVFEETIDANGGAKTQGAWKQKHIDLSAYAGETIYIAWRHFNCTDQYVFLLDDIYIGVPTAAEESAMTEIAVYPNPASNMLTITNAEGSKVVVVNALGQVVTEINNASANQTIDLSKFANGTYIVKANGQVVKFNVVK